MFHVLFLKLATWTVAHSASAPRGVPCGAVPAGVPLVVRFAVGCPESDPCVVLCVVGLPAFAGVPVGLLSAGGVPDGVHAAAAVCWFSVRPWSGSAAAECVPGGGLAVIRWCPGGWCPAGLRAGIEVAW